MSKSPGSKSNSDAQETANVEARDFYQSSMSSVDFTGRKAASTQSVELLRVNRSASIFGSASAPMVYSPYGHLHLEQEGTVLAFNGQRYDGATQGYLLGNGYRLFNTTLMRFCSADSLSPFGDGGLNAYVYCQGDPVNNVDPSGHSLQSWVRGLWRSSEGTLKHYSLKADAKKRSSLE